MAMPIALTCRCGKQLQVGEIHAGKQGRCPSCDAVLDIPAARTGRLVYSLAVFIPPLTIDGIIRAGFSAPVVLLLPPFLVFGIARLTQAKAYHTHLRDGGKKHPLWKAAITALVSSSVCGG